MNERDLADRFNQDVDRLLNESGRADSEPVPTEYRRTLDVARRLAATDFSPESHVRLPLRRRLLSRVDARETPRKERTMRTHPQLKLRRPLFIAISLALVVLLVEIFLTPGGPAVAAYNVSTNVKLIVLGTYSRAQQIEATVTGKPMPDDTWHITLFKGAGVGGNGLPGTNPEVRSVTTLEEAQELVSFRIRLPEYLPEGYALREVKVAPVWTGPGALFFPSNPGAYLFYAGPGADIVISQMPVGPVPSGDPNVAVGVFSGFGTNGPLEEVTFDGHTAAWATNVLTWEAESIGYLVGGPEMTLEQAIQIAESLK
jgi:hypothetical protein